VFREEKMDLWINSLFFALGVMVLYLISYINSIIHPPKSVFQEPTNHIEIKNWTIKKS
jgi:hypothetical protein